MLKLGSVLSYGLMLLGLLGLIATGSFLSLSPLIITAQVAAVALMLWARMTFGLRSFHASADPTGGGLVTSGPYRFIRHPIYTAACLFAWASAFAHLSWFTVGCAILVLAGSLGRILAEEHLLAQRYPEYKEWAARTKRIIPYIF